MVHAPATVSAKLPGIGFKVFNHFHDQKHAKQPEQMDSQMPVTSIMTL